MLGVNAPQELQIQGQISGVTLLDVVANASMPPHPKIK
jgi:hypothetical protein